MSPEKQALMQKLEVFAKQRKGEIDEEHSTDTTIRVLTEFYCYDFDVNGTVSCYDFNTEKSVDMPIDELI